MIPAHGRAPMNAIILAGGLSRRMNGTRKAFLRLGGETFLERVLGVVRPLVDSVLIVTNEPERYAGFAARASLVGRLGGGGRCLRCRRAPLGGEAGAAGPRLRPPLPAGHGGGPGP